MRLMPLGGLLVALLVFAPVACGTGPVPRPVDTREQLSAEATARTAAERTRAGQQGVIYASSEAPAEAQAEDIQAHHSEGVMATSTAELRLNFDDEGRLLIDGQPVALTFAGAENADLPGSPEAASDTEHQDALVAALTEALKGLEPADRLRILIASPPIPQRFDLLFAAVGRVVAEATVPVELHITPAP
ncbi:hypothetical protein EA187_14535 [Lujinxingia sediminis]|uniref:Uncharacterized protein n=1 Tax=Lujinxingia sediminis TaxID=2480984 RepID=A0ABY0CRB9_9DELT|nr:hypothetical protein [Lujinxingia sediminis]RVU42728.1 hypothetical protein EA187_14535 [Lujinxingia sediminis]